MDNLTGLTEKMKIANQLSLSDMPDLDLYMDQVIQLFNNKFSDTRRNEEEKVLTKTMINNYAKGKLFFPIKNKKYSKEHLMMISMIYQMKSSLSISDVKTTLDPLNGKITEEAFDLSELYQSYQDIMGKNQDRFNNALADHVEEVSQEIQQQTAKDGEYLELMLLVASLSGMSNLYRKAAELIVDEIAAIKDVDA